MDVSKIFSLESFLASQEPDPALQDNVQPWKAILQCFGFTNRPVWPLSQTPNSWSPCLVICGFFWVVLISVMQ